jgi:hypothetical protein
MPSIGLWRWYINITITILDIIHRPVFYLRHDVSETGFYLRLQVKPTQLSSIDRGSLCLQRQKGLCSVHWALRHDGVWMSGGTAPPFSWSKNKSTKKTAWSGQLGEPVCYLVHGCYFASWLLLGTKTKTKTETKLHGLSTQANYTDRATAACRGSECQLLQIEVATWSTWRIPTAVFSAF